MFRNFSTERFLRSLHSWMGALILPWIVLAGFTGLYLNHRDVVKSVLPMRAEVSGAQFAADPEAHPVDRAAARRRAEAIVPDGPWRRAGSKRYKGRSVYRFGTEAGTVIVDRQTGGAWLRDRYMITAYAPDGERMARTLRWGRILRSIHERGFVGTALGRWLADITAGALVIFGLSGLVLFASPRFRRRRNRRARRAAARETERQAALARFAAEQAAAAGGQRQPT